jgi:hypothetical protein
LRPGAILDIPRAARRYFLEPEVGATGLAPEDPREAHVKRRLERYSTFFFSITNWDTRETFYRRAFPDGFHASVLVLALSEARRIRIERHVNSTYRLRDTRHGMRAFTWPGAVAELTSLVKASSAPAPEVTSRQPAVVAPATPPGPPTRMVAIDADLARQIRHGLRLFVDTHDSIQKQTSAHAYVCPMHFKPDPGPVADLNAFNDLVWDVILGMPREPEKDRKP